MFCAKCSEKLTEDTKFCSKCGAAVQGGDGSQSAEQGGGGRSNKSKLVGWLLVAVGVALPFVASTVEGLAVPLLWIGFAMVISGSSVIVRVAKGLIAMLIVFGSIFFLKEQIPATQTTSENVRPDLEVELGRLLTDYSGNEIAADNKYKGKVIRTVGYIRDVGKDIIDDPYVLVSMSLQESIPELQCALAKSAVDYAASLTAGQPVIIQGKVTGLMMNVQAEKCTFLQPQDLPEAESETVATDDSDASEPKMVADQEASAGDEGQTAEEQAAEEVSGSPEQQCTTTYRWATAESFSPEAVAEFQSECPGFDLPVAWQEAQADGSSAASASEDAAACVEDKVTAYREEMGEEAMVRADMLQEWETGCLAQSATEQPELLPASFDCAKASTPVEKMICDDPQIANLDGQLAKDYGSAVAASVDASDVKADQRNWVKQRNACQDLACVIRAYRARIEELQK